MDQPAHQPTVSDAVEKTIQSAVQGYRNAHPNASAEDITSFTMMIEAKIRSTQRQSNSSELRTARKLRRQAVLEKIKTHGVKIANCRAIEVREMFGGTFPVGVSPTGGFTMAYKTEGDKTLVAAAICNPTDNFDYLEGRERAVDRFVQGLTMPIEVDDITKIDPEVLRDDYHNLLRAAAQR